MVGLGELAVDSGNFREAQNWLESGLLPIHEIGERRFLVAGLTCLGAAVWESGDAVTARNCFREAFTLALEMRATPLSLSCLTRLIELLREKDLVEKGFAVEILALVMRHPAVWQEVKVRAERSIAGLQKEMPPAIFSLALERRQTAFLNDLVTEGLEYRI